MATNETFTQYAFHLAQSEEYKRMKEASAQNATAYYTHGAQESEHKARAYELRASLGDNFPVQEVAQTARAQA
ncbi:hypothetical protein [Paenibacillus xerothermodurans]|uniref:Uncharacterized protein n=1 Tax=Paenibacillus xerothermodurans TaxID=1977292 RepID=A0A2W1N7A4_PAEXE|nr:hypothetical protein [Paenibacillus xerothermodurans]PZE20287.1 hypothetical protein CBW46_014150 [Paenibacillus xerothermodurans]